MIASAAPGLSVTDLERLLRQADPAALLVPPRILRRVLKADRGLTGPGLQVPHRKSYVIRRESLLRIATRSELGLPADAELPATVMLFPRPDAHRLASQPRDAALLRCWRRLFHARVHAALAQRMAEGHLTDASIRTRVERIGLTPIAEARSILRQERLLLPPGDLATVYEEFAALYLELRFFEPRRLAVYFPALTDQDTVDAVLAEDVDARALFQATRPQGAPDPAEPVALTEEEEELEPAADDLLPESAASPPPTGSLGRMLHRADREAERGNHVRAAILRQQALAAAPPDQVEILQAAALNAIEQLLDRLRRALQLPEAEVDSWRHALRALLEPAARGTWSVEARLLYDLQKVCGDRERDIYAVDLVEWVVSWGQRPIKRRLPNQPLVLAVKHLRGALHRMTRVRLEETARRQLVNLLLEALHQAEARLRERFRPLLQRALDDVGLRPENVAEQLSRRKLIEELLDRVVARGFLNMGDLRDALARNQVKLPDLAGPAELILGDRLIRANRECATSLDGVYHRGEIYLRWLQRLSALSFGTVIGRWLTLFVALPFGASFSVFKMLEEITGFVSKSAAHAIDRHAVVPGTIALGVFFLGLIHLPWFRRVVAHGLHATAHGLHFLFLDLPTQLLRLPWVQRILASRVYLLVYQLVLKPALWAVPVWLVLYLAGAGLRDSLGGAGIIFLAAALLFNSRLGQYLEEIWTDALVRTWHLFRSDLIPNLFRWIVYVFQWLLESFERLVYRVDESLRFRTGESRWALVWKPALGLVWFGVTYFFRFLINLFVEPTINPLKHFPAVTVAAKMILPWYIDLVHFFRTPFIPILGLAPATALGTLTVILLPGLAGFLVWELKENWRLYRANRARRLRPVVIGSHGETMLHFMKPGLHSGTLPKLYARLRHSRGAAARRRYEQLHHVREALQAFLERELLAVLASSKGWGTNMPLRVHEVLTATNRVRYVLMGPEGTGASAALDFEVHAGWLVAGFAPAAADTWLARLSYEQRRTLHDALAGFYQWAGVDLVREQLQGVLPAGTAYDVNEEGLVIWPAAGFESGAIYDLGEPSLPPRPLVANVPLAGERLPPERLLFSLHPIAWSAWVETWENDRACRSHTSPLLPGIRMLPPRPGAIRAVQPGD